MLVDRLLPRLLEERDKVRIWSAACSTGEEPLTLAGLLSDRGLLPRVELVAERHQPARPVRGKSGQVQGAIAPRAAARPLPAWLDIGDQVATVKENLARSISWHRLNLVDSRAVGELGRFDVIICRNVLIYFRDATIKALAAAFETSLTPGGYLLIGASESLLRFGSGLQCEEHGGAFFYGKAVAVTRIRVLVVDDSAFARKVIRQVLDGSERIEVVGIAHDGLDALERIAELKPDVVTLDLVMPNLDGVGLLQALQKLSVESRPRVVVVSMSAGDSDLAIAALHEGAVDIVQKPTALANDRLYELSDELIRKVEAAATARVRPSTPSATAPGRGVAASALPTPKHELVVIGASTGGPQAVAALLSALPKNFPVPIAVVVHIPEGFSQSLAEHLDRVSELTVTEAADGDLLRPGSVLSGARWPTT